MLNSHDTISPVTVNTVPLRRGYAHVAGLKKRTLSGISMVEKTAYIREVEGSTPSPTTVFIVGTIRKRFTDETPDAMGTSDDWLPCLLVNRAWVTPERGIGLTGIPAQSRNGNHLQVCDYTVIQHQTQ
jgi:hypothetical protein